MDYKANYDFILKDSKETFVCGDEYDLTVKEADKINERGKKAFPSWDKPFLERLNRPPKKKEVDKDEAVS